MVKQLTGIDDINHVVNVNFTGFADAVNAIGCVYVDVDHHYFHSNAGLAPAEQYAEIDIPAGYQRMCGLNALAYVRYRHDDNDLVRAARQQEFLRQARQELPAAEIAGDFNDLNRIAEKYVTIGHSQGDGPDHARASCSWTPAVPRSSRSTSPPTSAGPPPRT